MALKLSRIEFHALGGINEIQIYTGSNCNPDVIFEKLVVEVSRIEGKFSRYRHDSVVARINSLAGNDWCEIDPETAELISFADECFHASNGLFDITAGVLRKVWNFQGNSIPSDSMVAEILPFIGWQKVLWNGERIKLEKGMELDLGGIGKEYAADSVAKISNELGVFHGLINLGGDLRVIGVHPTGEPWKVGVKDPEEKGVILGSIEISNGGFATSGDYERCIELNGRRYCHILNPKTGWPAFAAHSVSVLSSSALLSGALATVFMLLPEKVAAANLESLEVRYLIVTSNDELLSNFRQF